MEHERSTHMRKAIAAIATAAIVLGGFSVALVLQSPDVASAQEVETEDTGTAVPAGIEDVLADLVEDGVITEEQSTQIADALRDRIGHFRGHRGGLDRGGHLETVAGVIDVDVAALAEALRDGQTIADVAEANGSSAQAVIDALVAEMNTNLDQAVEDGKLTADKADEIRADAPDRIESMVNDEFEGRMGFGRHRGMGPGFGPNLEDSDAKAKDTSA
jgi:polyhydroxyalkanoate synthesis regulator phasin